MLPPRTEMPEQGRNRVIIERVWPEIDAGRFAVKRVVDQPVEVGAETIVDGHDRPRCALLWRHESDDGWSQAPMDQHNEHQHNVDQHDKHRWAGQFRPTKLGEYYYRVVGWIDHFATWRHDLTERIGAGQPLELACRIGAELLAPAVAAAAGADHAQTDAARLAEAHQTLANADIDATRRAQLGIDAGVAESMRRWAPRRFTSRFCRDVRVHVERRRALFSSWYEMFPRSTTDPAVDHGSFADAHQRLDYIAELGFDVVYFPPIHPIGRIHRKGKNNRPDAGPQDVGSPWAIGADEGGHRSIHPRLGTGRDLARLMDYADQLGLEIALDIAFQTAPDHPWVDAHPEWFEHRPDGSIQYAENPPKKYEDIYPLDFETDQWRQLWERLEAVVRHWCDQGVRIFRVDNPHTKPLAMWEWLIARIQRDFPTTIFLAEAFARPAMMYRLAKLGFSQSYTYFTWRNTADELTSYLRELTDTEVVEFMRPNFWPNTPDILTEVLQSGKRPAFMLRAALAATMSASFGIYGPAFELMEHRPRQPGSEEYLDSEKYQIRHWDIDHPDSLAGYIGRLNRIRAANAALQQNRHTHIHRVDNPQLLAYSKRTADHSNVILTVANVDIDHPQEAMVELAGAALGVDLQRGFEVHDLLDGARYTWHGRRNYVRLDPNTCPVHVFRVHQT